MASFRHIALRIVGLMLMSGPVFAEPLPAKPVAAPSNGAIWRPMVPVRTPSNTPGNGQSNSAPSGPPYNVTTEQLRVVGGTDLLVMTFAPVSVTTGTLSAVGGMDASVSFAPVVVTTGPLSVVGGR